MPYTPAESKAKYPWMTAKQAEVFSKTFNNALKEYGSESKAFSVALAAAKKSGGGKPDKKKASRKILKLRVK